MSREVEIVVALPEHARYLASRLRAEHVAEITAFPGLSPEACLLDALEHSSGAFTYLVNGEPVGMFGVAPDFDEPGTAYPWLLGSPQLARHPKAMVTVGRRAVREWLGHYAVLRSFVDQRYSQAILWAKAIGFTIGAPRALGNDGEMFVPIEARA